MFLALGNPRYSFLTVLAPVYNAPGLGQPQVQPFNSAFPCTQSMLLALNNPRYSFLTVISPVNTVMLLALNNQRYSFLTVISPVHNAPGPEQPQVQLFNSASLCTQCSWAWATPGTAF
jgi:hypothetical protein